MTYKKKLIEVALPLAKINEESAREKSIRHGHPSTLHLWWARRPLAAARAVLFAQLVDDPSAHPDLFPTEEDQHLERKRLLNILERLVPWEATSDERVLDEARAEIRASSTDGLPTILDPFAGGGTIPLEAMRLGLPTHSGDLNPVAVLIQKAMLDVPTRFSGMAPVHEATQSPRGIWSGAEGLAADIHAYAAWMLEEAHSRVGGHFPEATLSDGVTAPAIGWMWVRTVKSPDPSWPHRVPLAKSWTLSKRPSKPVVWVEPIVDLEAKSIRYALRRGGNPAEGTVRREGAVCIATGAPIPFSYIREQGVAGQLGMEMVAVIAEGARGREFAEPQEADRAAATCEPTWRPEGLLPKGGLGFRVQNYGLLDWASLFSPRQAMALATLCDLLDEVRPQIEEDALRAGVSDDRIPLHQGGRGARAYSDAVTTYLAFVIDRVAPRWCTLTAWHNGGEKIEQVFRRQAISMNWDFPEANPFSSSTGGWRGQVDWVTRCLLLLPSSNPVDVVQREASSRVRELGRCVVSTDPPYYDNVGYADLSDFFFVWMRRTLGSIWPDECATLLTPKRDELIADPDRAGSRANAVKHFESGMTRFFGEVATHNDPDYPATVFYAFKATEFSAGEQVSTGWETFLSGLLTAGLTVTATWPIRTELTGGLRHVGRNSLATSVVLACRQRRLDAPMATRGELIAALRTEMPPAIRLLQQQNIAPVDMAQSAIGPGIGVFSRFARVIEADGSSMSIRAALSIINEFLAEVLSGEESEFDPDTRFAVTWFEQFGQNPASFGDADILAKAKNTTVEGVVRAGVVVSREGRVRLLERSELPKDWDPQSDSRLTVWETTQHLIRALESSESEAADLLRKLGGGMGERARQLAYLLYGICDRKKWAEEAGAYNMLVTAWPEIERLAATGQGDADADRLF